MSRGGRREGAGRPRGSVSGVSKAARERAAATGELPHEFLLRIARGVDDFDDYVTVRGRQVLRKRKPSFAERIDAAKSAAPYYQPRLAQADMRHSGHITLDQVAESVLPEQRLEVSKELLRVNGYEFDD